MGAHCSSEIHHLGGGAPSGREPTGAQQPRINESNQGIAETQRPTAPISPGNRLAASCYGFRPRPCQTPYLRRPKAQSTRNHDPSALISSLRHIAWVPGWRSWASSAGPHERSTMGRRPCTRVIVRSDLARADDGRRAGRDPVITRLTPRA